MKLYTSICLIKNIGIKYGAYCYSINTWFEMLNFVQMFHTEFFLLSPSSILTNRCERSSHCCTTDAICLQSYYFQGMVWTSYFIITEKYCVLCGQQIAPVLPKIRNISQNRVLASYLLWTSIEHYIWLNYWLQELHDIVDLKFWADLCREKKSCLWIGCVVDYSPFWWLCSIL